MAKKKLGSGGRFGTRYGKKIRQKVSDIEEKSRALHKCPDCRKVKVKRVASGIWHCKSCDVTIAGKAYTL